jgi:hypothetical protein
MNTERTGLHRNKVLRSRKPLRRKTRIKAKRSTPRRSGRVRDRRYLLAVKELPCCLALLMNCDGPVHAHHAGARPLGRKADDSTAIPLCAAHHQALHDGGLLFGVEVVGFLATSPNREWRTRFNMSARDWQDRMITETRAALGWREAA